MAQRAGENTGRWYDAERPARGVYCRDVRERPQPGAVGRIPRPYGPYGVVIVGAWSSGRLWLAKQQQAQTGEEPNEITSQIFERHVFVCTGGDWCATIDGDGLGVHGRL